VSQRTATEEGVCRSGEAAGLGAEVLLAGVASLDMPSIPPGEGVWQADILSQKIRHCFAFLDYAASCLCIKAEPSGTGMYQSLVCGVETRNELRRTQPVRPRHWATPYKRSDK
jgi:hypothetical protein